MEKTPFAGLTQLDGGEPLSVDGYSFQHENPRITDRLLEIGSIGHHHDAHAALADPSALPVVAAVVGGGNVLGDATIWATYTLLDANGGETRPATAQSVTTAAPLDPPNDSPTVALDTTSGTLLANSYMYALTLTDGAGGETTLGPSVMITRPTGPANAHVVVSGMAAIMAASGATGWRLWRSVGGGRFGYLTQGSGDSFSDDGSSSPDCTMNPPTGNTTHGVNMIRVTVPGGQPAGTAQYRVYLSIDGSFESPAVAGTYAIGTAGTPIDYPVIDLADGSPPDVSVSLPGASKINPATDIQWLAGGDSRQRPDLHRHPDCGHRRRQRRGAYGRTSDDPYLPRRRRDKAEAPGRHDRDAEQRPGVQSQRLRHPGRDPAGLLAR
jgi:hypothetical protein